MHDLFLETQNSAYHRKYQPAHLLSLCDKPPKGDRKGRGVRILFTQHNVGLCLLHFSTRCGAAVLASLPLLPPLCCPLCSHFAQAGGTHPHSLLPFADAFVEATFTNKTGRGSSSDGAGDRYGPCERPPTCRG